jgi:hypothetical protein
MKIKDLLSHLLPTFGKDTLLEDIRVTRGSLEQLEELYGDAADELKGWKFKSSEVKSMVSTFKSMVGGGDNPIVNIAKGLKTVLKNLDTCETLAASILNGQVAAKGMTYKQAILVQYCDAVFLVEKYARKWLNFVLVMESAEYKENGLPIDESIPKPELEWLKKTFVDFCVAYKAASEQPEKVTKDLESVPEIDVDSSDAKALAHTRGPGLTDPFKLGFIATKANPIYFVRMVIAEWQVKRYKESREELSALQLRLLYLKRLEEGRADAATEQRIRYLESRIQTLSADLADMEKDYV